MQVPQLRYLFLIFFILHIPRPAIAQAKPMDITYLTQESAAIIIGEVREMESKWVGTQIHTIVEIDINESLKGGLSEAVSVRIPGGKVLAPWPMEMRVSHAPQFQIAEKVLLFLWRSPGGKYAPLGLEQGAVSLLEEPGSGTILLERYPPGSKQLQSTEDSDRVADQETAQKTLDDFKQEILEVLKQ